MFRQREVEREVAPRVNPRGNNRRFLIFNPVFRIYLYRS